MKKTERKALFTIYSTDVGESAKIEVVSDTSKKERAVVLEAMKFWIEGVSEKEVSEATREIGGRFPEMAEEFRLLKKQMDEMNEEDARALSRDVSKVMRGLRLGK